MQIPCSRHYAPFCGLLISLCAILAPCTTGYAQPHSEPPEPGGRALSFGHQAWSNENGLPQNSVHQILQTRDGYLWIATEGGVARFNGVQFAVFNHEDNPAFTSNDTCCLAEDRNGSLWIGTADGLLQYAGGTFRRYAVTDGLPSAVVVSLAATDDGLFVLTTEGLAGYDGHKFTQLKLSPSAIGTGAQWKRMDSDSCRDFFVQPEATAQPAAARSTDGANRGPRIFAGWFFVGANANCALDLESRSSALLADRP